MEDREVKRMVELTVSTDPAGNATVMRDGIWVRFREIGNLHIYPTLGVIEASRESARRKGRRLADALRAAGFAMYEVRVRG